MFDFGKNWQAYSEHALNDAAVEAARESVRRLLGTGDLTGKRLLDLGSGSGLFSAAAAQLGADVTAVDINPRSVEATRQNAARILGTPDSIRVLQGSALDGEFMDALGQFDIVYSWGVLHHTGSMWEAIKRALRAVAPGGTLVLAIYNRHFTSGAWRGIKWTYVHSPEIGRRALEVVSGGAIYTAKLLVTRQNPLKKERGMSFWYDVVDWVGGYPYEYASVGEISDYVTTRGFTLERVIPAQVPTGCNEFVFTRAR
jgi:2-polyprenyl-6-hydroxyphenyl methylase/3-demethylubiquinone-9 3-methyltransferase